LLTRPKSTRTSFNLSRRRRWRCKTGRSVL
jgi:hypothetical protein